MALCGAITGGPIAAGSEMSSLDDEWTRACEGPSGNKYPYGYAPTVGACDNSNPDGGAGDLTVVGTLVKCEGGEPGVFDMSGNAAEWENDCAPNEDGGFTCGVRGGSYQYGAMVSDCQLVVTLPSTVGHRDIGFRCCASP